MMSLIILISGIFNLITSWLIYRNIHEFDMNKKRLVTYFTFASFFMFSGFLRLKVSFIEGIFNFSKFDLFNQQTMFAAISCISNGIFMFIANDLIKIERKC